MGWMEKQLGVIGQLQKHAKEEALASAEVAK